MKKLLIRSTSDIPLPELELWASGLLDDRNVDVKLQQLFLKSATAPSWITLLAELDWWVTVFGGVAATYTAGLLSEAGKETWRERARFFPTFSAGLGRISGFASKIIQFKSAHPRSKIIISLPFPDDYFGTSMELGGHSAELVAAEFALYVHYLPKLRRLIADLTASNAQIVGQITLVLNDDASLQVSWMDRSSLKVETRRLDV